MITVESPTRLRFSENFTREQLEKVLSYTNKAAVFELNRFRKNRWYSQQHGQEAFEAKLEELKAAAHVCLLKEDDKGLYTYAGLAGMLRDKFTTPLTSLVEYPDSKPLPYANKPEHTSRYYQSEAVERMLETRHAGVELATGAGKSKCIEMLIKSLGLQTVVMAPSKSIAGQLYRQLVHRFGGKYVGMYGDGKKKIDKLITVGISASLTRIEEKSEAWNKLSTANVFIADESHLCPADTLASVCHGLCRDAPYRFFFSGTQLRADGTGLLLDGITGPIVLKKNVRELVDEGFLAKPRFFMHRVPSKKEFLSREYLDMAQVHFWNNPDLHAYAADLANRSVQLLGHQVLLLVEHVDQLQYLLPYFKYEIGFAHGGLSKGNKDSVDPRYHASDVDALVDRFNAGKLPILVGTSCVTTGTDFKGVRTIINLQGGQSEIKIRQAIGRGTRLAEGKTEFNYHDFFVKLPDYCHQSTEDEFGDTQHTGLTTIERHCLARKETFDDVYGPTTWIGT